MIRSSLIGTWIGILPGVGANIGSIVAYTGAKTFSKEPEKFGTGSEEGIIASESANNATVGGALVPLIAMGIPGSVIDAILLGALLVHSIQPGPLLFINNPDVVYTMIATALVANVLMFAIMALLFTTHLYRSLRSELSVLTAETFVETTGSRAARSPGPGCSWG